MLKKIVGEGGVQIPQFRELRPFSHTGVKLKQNSPLFPLIPESKGISLKISLFYIFCFALWKILVYFYMSNITLELSETLYIFNLHT